MSSPSRVWRAAAGAAALAAPAVIEAPACAGTTPSTHNAEWAKATVGLLQAQPREGAPGTSIAANPIRHSK